MQIEQVRAADEHLLCVVIALSRHSPAAAKAVMKCPRLMDSVIQRFLLTDEDLNGGLRPAHTKAIQLLKVCFQIAFYYFTLSCQLQDVVHVLCMLQESSQKSKRLFWCMKE